MVFKGRSTGTWRFAPALLGAAGLALAIPGAGLAVSSVSAPETSLSSDFLPFTPAGADPALAQKVAAVMGEDALRFTPANKPAPIGERTVNFAVRVDESMARSLSSRAAADSIVQASPVKAALPIAPTRYNLGMARGFQSFAQPARSIAETSVAKGLQTFDMPDLGKFASDKDDDGKPSRFQSRIALEQQGNAGSTPLTLEGAGTQRVDLGGSYRLGRNLDVTAGVRIKQDRDRLGPLTDGMEDDQAVYVGTQIRF